MPSQKKGILQKILSALIPYWEPAEGFLLLLQEESNDEIIEKLYKEILENIKNIKSSTQQEQIKTALQRLKERSEQVTKAEEEEADQMLDDFINNI